MELNDLYEFLRARMYDNGLMYHYIMKTSDFLAPLRTGQRFDIFGKVRGPFSRSE